MTEAEQAAVDYMADALSGAPPVQVAKSLETAEFYFRDVPETQRREAIIKAAACAVARKMNGEMP